MLFENGHFEPLIFFLKNLVTYLHPDLFLREGAATMQWQKGAEVCTPEFSRPLLDLLPLALPNPDVISYIIYLGYGYTSSVTSLCVSMGRSQVRPLLFHCLRRRVVDLGSNLVC